jgi:uncharacterized membrane protein
MGRDQTQDEINRAEWGSVDNWSGYWPFLVYFSKRDSRMWIPTSAVWGGMLFPWTVNLGHKFGYLFMILTTAGALGLLVAEI